MNHEQQQIDYRQYLDRTNIISSGGAAKVVCPICPKEHVICQFTAGTLSCVVVGCANPHHR